MMDEKEKIQKLFDDYADELADQSHLASKARQQMANRPKRLNLIKWLSPVAAFCVLAVICIAVLPNVAPPLSTPDYTPNDSSASGPVVAYDVSEVKGRLASVESVAHLFNIDNLQTETSKVVYQKFGEYYLDGELVYVKAEIGVITESGITEVYAMAEKDGYLRSDLEADVANFANGQAIVSHSWQSNGEYVTNAYFCARGMHFYVYATGGTDNAEEIIYKMM